MRTLTAVVAVAALCFVAACSAKDPHISAFTAPKTALCAYEGFCNPKGWTLVGKTPAEQFHTVVFAVKNKEGAADSCDSLLDEISNPLSISERRGKHLTVQEVGELFSVPEYTKAVEDWLASKGFSFTTTINGDYVSVDATIEELEDLLGAQFHTFRSPHHGRSIMRTPYFSLPKEVADKVDFVGNTIYFPPSQKMNFMSHKVNSRAKGTITPQDITKFYGISNTIVTSPKATQSLFEALGQDFSPKDLTTFQKQFGLKQKAVDKVIGPNNPNACESDPDTCAEANLDVQYMMAIAQEATTTYWSIDASAQDPFLDWILALYKTSNPPLVHSISYGSLAAEDPDEDVQRFNTDVCKLGLQGLTIMVSSGDDGVANFEARDDPSMCGFSPSFPATSPYVVAVGATQGPEFGHPEIACMSNAGGLITTGGGFSIHFNRPSYQDQAVQTYFKTAPNLPPLSKFNSKGRGYPDVALLGHNYVVVIGGQSYVLSGTSASSPVFAGMITLINDMRFNNGKGPLGFINPTLYQLGYQKSPAFNDVKIGENNCCAGNPGQQVCCPLGFNATAGWDPLTGWGSVNFPLFSKSLATLVP
ncbi:Prokumamolisin, activation domain containing protein [Balamuthia mandrillaris]